MPRAADGVPSLSETLACEVAGVTPQTRRNWARKGLLEQHDARVGFTELQVIEAAVLAKLHEALGSRDAAAVWRDLRQSFRESLPSPRLDVVVDVAYREGTIVTTDHDLVEVVRAEGRLIRVIVLRTMIDRIQAAFKRLTQASGSKKG